MKSPVLRFPFVMISASVFAILAAVGLTAFADDPTPQLQPFTYRVQVPSGSESCADHARDIAAVFAATSDAQSVSGACESRHKMSGSEVDTIIISYQDYNEIAPERTIFSGNAFLGTHYAADGVFESYQDCLKEISPQLSLFAAQTTLTPLDAYCTASDNSRYLLTIESFGTPKAYLQEYATEDGLDPFGTAAQTVEAAKNALVQAGGVIAYSDSQHVFYYSKSGLSVIVRDLGMFETDADCAIQKDEAVSIFAQAGMIGTSAFCKSAVLNVVAAGPDMIYDDFGYHSDHYTSLGDCLSDKARVLANATSNGSHPLGLICEQDTDSTANTAYVIHYFYKNQ